MFKDCDANMVTISKTGISVKADTDLGRLGVGQRQKTAEEPPTGNARPEVELTTGK
jgi:hypothetical protein